MAAYSSVMRVCAMALAYFTLSARADTAIEVMTKDGDIKDMDTCVPQPCFSETCPSTLCTS